MASGEAVGFSFGSSAFTASCSFMYPVTRVSKSWMIAASGFVRSCETATKTERTRNHPNFFITRLDASFSPYVSRHGGFGLLGPAIFGCRPAFWPPARPAFVWGQTVLLTLLRTARRVLLRLPEA